MPTECIHIPSTIATVTPLQVPRMGNQRSFLGTPKIPGSAPHKNVRSTKADWGLEPLTAPNSAGGGVQVLLVGRKASLASRTRFPGREVLRPFSRVEGVHHDVLMRIGFPLRHGEQVFEWMVEGC